MIRSITPLHTRSPQHYRPKSITLGLENDHLSTLFKSSFPSKKLSQFSQLNCRKLRPQSHKKVRTENAQNIDRFQPSLQPERIKQIFEQRISKPFQKESPKNATKLSVFKPKLKYKMSRMINSQRTNTVNSLDYNTETEISASKKLSCLVFGLANMVESIDQQRKVAQSPNIYVHRSSGKRERVDSYMYLRKVKAKAKHKTINEVHGETLKQRQNSSQRDLYIEKDHGRKKSRVGSYVNLVRNSKKINVQKYEEEKHEYRPWSARGSDISD